MYLLFFFVSKKLNSFLVNHRHPQNEKEDLIVNLCVVLHPLSTKGEQNDDENDEERRKWLWGIQVNWNGMLNVSSWFFSSLEFLAWLHHDQSPLNTHNSATFWEAVFSFYRKESLFLVNRTFILCSSIFLFVLQTLLLLFRLQRKRDFDPKDFDTTKKNLGYNDEDDAQFKACRFHGSSFGTSFFFFIVILVSESSSSFSSSLSFKILSSVQSILWKLQPKGK